MNVQELVATIKKERLYEYCLFQIGPPHSLENIGTYSNGSEVEGICEIGERTWNLYCANERGGVMYAYGGKELSEDDACRDLLDTMRIKKDYSIACKKKKIHYRVQNADKWLTTKD